MNDEQMIEGVKEYYGKVLKNSNDLKTSACCTVESMPLYLRDILTDIHSEVKDKFYGCGSPIPLGLKGKTILDLGSGSGRDCYLLSKMVGPTGKVIGVDMTDEQIAVAKKHVDYHTDKFGFTQSNIEFVTGYIEDLKSLGIEDSSIDIVTSNCVVNLSPNKKQVLSEVFRVLKSGGEFYFSDIFANRRLPKELAEDDIMIGECLGGALYTEDFRRILNDLGCADFRAMSNVKIDLFNDEIKQKSIGIDFHSITIRAFKLELEDRCEDYGQVATYLGTIEESPRAFRLDDHHFFEAGKPGLVCGNTAKMLSDSRFGEHFRIEGNTNNHFGLFDCNDETVSSKDDGIACC